MCYRRKKRSFLSLLLSPLFSSSALASSRVYLAARLIRRLLLLLLLLQLWWISLLSSVSRMHGCSFPPPFSSLPLMRRRRGFGDIRFFGLKNFSRRGGGKRVVCPVPDFCPGFGGSCFLFGYSSFFFSRLLRLLSKGVRQDHALTHTH